jgi:molybdenum cofactor guanylyltransferase
VSVPGPSPVAGIVLAGGRSTRFGRDKLAEPLGATSLLQRAVDGVAAVSGVVVVVVAPDAPDPAVASSVPLRIARDAVQAQGPLAGLIAGLAVVREPLCVVAAGDMPFLRASVLGLMVRVASEDPSGAVVLGGGGGPRPLPCVLRTEEALGEARPAFESGDRSLRSLIEALGARVIPERDWAALDPDRRTLRDVDRPQDLAD